ARLSPVALWRHHCGRQGVFTPNIAASGASAIPRHRRPRGGNRWFSGRLFSDLRIAPPTLTRSQY
ncbi:MAG TPA: hypothetical protein VFB99_04210, partial [Vicinamibacterales bacterium]|nr:hypothetical protein [Vicinamibacterales bacterium]